MAYMGRPEDGFSLTRYWLGLDTRTKIVYRTYAFTFLTSPQILRSLWKTFSEKDSVIVRDHPMGAMVLLLGRFRPRSRWGKLVATRPTVRMEEIFASG